MNKSIVRLITLIVFSCFSCVKSFSQINDLKNNLLDSNLVYCYCDTSMFENSKSWLISEGWELKNTYYTDSLSKNVENEFKLSFITQFNSSSTKFLTLDLNDYFVQATPVFEGNDSSFVYLFGTVFHKSVVNSPDQLSQEIRLIFDGKMTNTYFVYTNNQTYFYK
jgi:hypothetical protein